MALLSKVFGCFRLQETHPPQNSLNYKEETLPDDILFNIFNRLSLSDLGNVSKVSRRFNAIVLKVYLTNFPGKKVKIKADALFTSIINKHSRSGGVFSSFQEIDMSKISTKEQFNECLIKTPHAFKLILKGNTVVPPEAINIGLKSMPYLRSIEFINPVNGNGIAQTIEGMPLLEKFVCKTNAEINISSAIQTLAQDSPNLGTLELKGKIILDSINHEYPLVTLSNRCVKLDRLLLSAEVSISLNVSSFINEVIKPHFIELSLTHINFTNADMQQLTLKCKQMQKLQVGFTKDLDPKILDNIFRQMKNLTVLELNGFSSDAAIVRFNQKAYESNMPANCVLSFAKSHAG